MEALKGKNFGLGSSHWLASTFDQLLTGSLTASGRQRVSGSTHQRSTLMDAQPVFPMDLEREIFETAALLHPRGIPTLLLVARRVLVW